MRPGLVYTRLIKLVFCLADTFFHFCKLLLVGGKPWVFGHRHVPNLQLLDCLCSEIMIGNRDWPFAQIFESRSMCRIKFDKVDCQLLSSAIEIGVYSDFSCWNIELFAKPGFFGLLIEICQSNM